MKIDAGKSVFNANEKQAARNVDRLQELKLTAINVMASPGAGKTSLIVHLLKRLPRELSVGVIEGDIASSIDTDRIKGLGFPAIQINTGGGCHLNATMVSNALAGLDVKGPGLLFIENIGNLICPAEFNLGEALRMVVANVAEGDDKPVKYPAMFATADLVILNKVDLLSLVEFKMDFFEAGVRAVNETAPIFKISCRSGDGIDAVRDFLLARQD